MKRSGVALITGAGRGIGRAVAQGLAEDGMHAVLFARTSAELLQVESEIKNAGGSAEAHVLDLTNREALRKTLSQIFERCGRVDILFNNAGIHAKGSTDASYEDFDRLIEVNLKAAFCMLKEVVPLMKRQNSGHIFNLSSICGKEGFAGAGAYTATKFALTGLNESLFRELVSLGIRVTALCPSWVDTQMASFSHIHPEQMIKPQDILSTVRYVLDLSAGAAVKEIVIDCSSDPQ